MLTRAYYFKHLLTMHAGVQFDTTSENGLGHALYL